jgi:hypothetical protein
MEKKQDKPEACELCGRDDTYLNFHHLIPKFVHGKGKFERSYEKEYMQNHGIWICKFGCHKTIHHFFTEKELAEQFNTLEKLLENEKIQKYVSWYKKQKKVK